MQLKNVWKLLMVVAPKRRKGRTMVPTPEADRFYRSGCEGLTDSRFYDRRMF